MLKRIVVILCAVVLASCGQPEPRKPIQVKSGQFFKASVARSQELLAKEQKLIKEIIATDSSRSYIASDSGFWYVYEKKNDASTYQLKTDDEVLLSYNLMHLNGDTIYSKASIGLVPHAIDKSKLFPGLRNAVKLLKEGEQATFIFPSSLGYGYKGDNDKIGPSTPLKSSMELVRIIAKKDSINSKLK